jgi:predicted nucleotidyltransferase
MKNRIKKTKELIAKNKRLLRQNYKVKNIGLFGSFAKGYACRKSDIDILVDFYEAPDMFKFIELEYFLKKLLGRKVDLVTRKALKPLIKNDILRETIYL